MTEVNASFENCALTVKMCSKRLKVLTLGDPGVGKTTLLSEYTGLQFSESTSLDADYLGKEVTVNGVEVSFQFWDRCGNHKKQALKPSFYANSDFCILVYSIDSRKSFEKVKLWRDVFVSFGGSEKCMILVGNKCDLENQRAVTRGEARNYAKSVNIVFKEVSAYKKETVEDAFNDIAKIVIRLDSMSSNTENCNKPKKERCTIS